MKKTRNIRITIILLMLLLSVRLFGLTGEEIIKKMEGNQVHRTSESKGSMAITDRFGTRTKTYIAYTEGDDKTLLEFTNPEEAGQRILRIDDEIYLYFPDAEEIIHLQGSALKDSVMGSDFSYEDLTGGRGLLEDYSVELNGTESVDGHPCYKVRLEAKKRDVVYPIQDVWVDSGMFVYRKVIMYSLKNRALKEMNIQEFQTIAGKTVPVRMELRDLMKKNSLTVFKTESLKIDIRLDASTFSLESLSW
jgi:hypothetical protein